MAKRKTPAQCLLRFMFAGALSVVLSAPTAIIINAAGGPVAVILFVPGIVFGAAFWLVTVLCIGEVASMRMLGVMCGCPAGFTVTGSVYDTMTPFAARMGTQWTWPELRRCICGPAAGVFIISSVVCVTGGFVHWRLLIPVWLAGTCLGFGSFFAFHELDARMNDQTTALFAAITFFQTAFLGLIGWQLSMARARSPAATRCD